MLLAMSKEYFQTLEMKGEKPFRCWNCHKLLIMELTGSNYKIGLVCPRCKCKLTIEANEILPIIQKEIG